MKKDSLLIPLTIILIGSFLGLTLSNQSPNHSAGHVPSDADPVAIAIHPDGQLPYLITADGQLLEADANKRWQPIGPQAKVNDVLYASTGHLWAATDSGLHLQQGDIWQQIDRTPGYTLESTHGFLFSIGPEGLVRLTESKDLSLDSLRALTVPASPAADLVMLGSHTHVLQAGDEVFHTLDVGLSWRPLDAPEPIRKVSTDANGDLIAVTDTQILCWNGTQWRPFLPLPEGQPIEAMRSFDGRIHALAAGVLYQQSGIDWQKSRLPDSQDAIFTALEFEYPDRLWLLDLPGRRLYLTTDGENWQITSIQIS